MAYIIEMHKERSWVLHIWRKKLGRV